LSSPTKLFSRLASCSNQDRPIDRLRDFGWVIEVDLAQCVVVGQLDGEELELHNDVDTANWS